MPSLAAAASIQAENREWRELRTDAKTGPAEQAKEGKAALEALEQIEAGVI